MSIKLMFSIEEGCCYCSSFVVIIIQYITNISGTKYINKIIYIIMMMMMMMMWFNNNDNDDDDFKQL